MAQIALRIPDVLSRWVCKHEKIKSQIVKKNVVYVTIFFFF